MPRRAYAPAAPGTKKASLDWSALGRVLANESDRPRLIVDACGAVLFCNAALENSFGWKQDDLVGRSWKSVLVRDPWRLKARHAREEVIAGKSHSIRTEIVFKSGERALVVFDAVVVSADGESVLVLSLSGARTMREAEDVEYEIELDGEAFGRLLRIGRRRRAGKDGGRALL